VAPRRVINHNDQVLIIDKGRNCLIFVVSLKSRHYIKSVKIWCL